MKATKNIILCDCRADEVAPLCSSLNFDAPKEFEVKSHISNWKRTGALSELKRYGKYFSVAFKYFCKRKNYDVIIGWQQFYALIFGFYCSVFHVKRKNKIIALNFTYKEKKGRFANIYRSFMSTCLKNVDYIHVPSRGYAEEFSRDFGFPLEKILVIPFGINDPYDKFLKLAAPTDAPSGGYALAIGRSNRDYGFLIDAWETVDYPLVIISDTYGGDSANPNVQILRNIAGEESYPWIANCNAMVIPIDDGSICSGDTVLLTSLAMKKKVLITAPSTLAEMYITDGENGLITEKEKCSFERIVKDILFTDRYDYLCDNARESYLNNYSRTSMGKRVSESLFK